MNWDPRLTPRIFPDAGSHLLLYDEGTVSLLNRFCPSRATRLLCSPGSHAETAVAEARRRYSERRILTLVLAAGSNQTGGCRPKNSNGDGRIVMPRWWFVELQETVYECFRKYDSLAAVDTAIVTSSTSTYTILAFR